MSFSIHHKIIFEIFIAALCLLASSLLALFTAIIIKGIDYRIGRSSIGRNKREPNNSFVENMFALSMRVSVISIVATLAIYIIMEFINVKG